MPPINNLRHRHDATFMINITRTQNEKNLYLEYSNAFYKFLTDVITHVTFYRAIKIIMIAADESPLPYPLIQNLLKYHIIFSPHSYPKSLGDGKCLSNSLLLYAPNVHYIKTNGFYNQLNMTRVPWDKKVKTAYWRGSTTGQENNCGNLQRVRMCLQSLNISWIDAKISNFCQICENDNSMQDYLRNNGLFSEHIPEHYWINHRGIIDIDGNTDAWGIFWRLGSGSVVFAVESSFCSFYTHFFKAFVHYIPISADLGDLVNKTRIVATENATEIELLQSMAKKSSLVVAGLSYHRYVLQFAKRLSNMVHVNFN